MSTRSQCRGKFLPVFLLLALLVVLGHTLVKSFTQVDAPRFWLQPLSYLPLWISYIYLFLIGWINFRWVAPKLLSTGRYAAYLLFALVSCLVALGVAPLVLVTLVKPDETGGMVEPSWFFLVSTAALLAIGTSLQAILAWHTLSQRIGALEEENAALSRELETLKGPAPLDAAAIRAIAPELDEEIYGDSTPMDNEKISPDNNTAASVPASPRHE